MNETLLIAGMLLATFVTRYPMMLLVSRIDIPAELTRAFKYVPIAVLSAIIAPLIFIQDDRLSLSLDNHFLLASLVAALVSFRTKNLLITILVGMGALFLVRLSFP